MSQLSQQSQPAVVFPEKILQFGLTARLRALPDWLVDQANRRGAFLGSVIAVGLAHETDTLTQLLAQDGRYTVYDNSQAENAVVISAISRVLSAETEWEAVLRLARQSNLQIILTDAYESEMVPETVFQYPPQTFAGKLTAFLYERFRDMGGSRNRGLVILALEATPNNGLRLREAVEQLAAHNELGKLFLKWLKFHVRFCNTIAERAIGTEPNTAEQATLTDALGYTDALLTPVGSDWHWAIEGDERVRKLLGFADAESGILIDEDLIAPQQDSVLVRSEEPAIIK